MFGLNFRDTAAMALMVGLFATGCSETRGTEPVAEIAPVVQTVERVSVPDTATVEVVQLEAVRVVPAPVVESVPAPVVAPAVVAPVEAVEAVQAPAVVPAVVVAPAPVEAVVEAVEAPADWCAELGWVTDWAGACVNPAGLPDAPTCEDQGMATAEDGSCVDPSFWADGPTCEDQGLVSRGDGTCMTQREKGAIMGGDLTEEDLQAVEVDHGGEPNPLDGFVPVTSDEGIVKGLDPNPAP